MELNHSVYFQPEEAASGEESTEIAEHSWENADSYIKKYQHPIWPAVTAEWIIW